MIHIDAIAYQSRWNEKYNITRISLILCWLVMMLLLNNFIFYMGSIVISILLTLVISQLNVIQYLKIVRVPLGFVFFTCLVLLPFIAHEIPFDYIRGFQYAGLWIGISEDSLKLATETLIRAMASINVVMFLSLTIPLQGLIKWMRFVHIPDAFTELFILTYRFIFVLIGIATELVLSQELRFGFFGVKNSTKSVISVASSLFIKAMERLGDLEASMELRFFTNEREK